MSDECQIIASPFEVIEAKTRKEWLERILKIINDYEVSDLVVGLPLDQHGEEGRDAQKMRPIISLLRQNVSIPVIEWDERFTTVQAEELLIEADMSRKRRKSVIDKVAAAIILKSYMESRPTSQTGSLISESNADYELY